MPRKKPEKFAFERWHKIVAAILAVMALMATTKLWVDSYIESKADEIVTERLQSYPPPEVWKDIKVTVNETNGKVIDLDKKVEGIDQFLRGKGVK